MRSFTPCIPTSSLNAPGPVSSRPTGALTASLHCRKARTQRKLTPRPPGRPGQGLFHKPPPALSLQPTASPRHHAPSPKACCPISHPGLLAAFQPIPLIHSCPFKIMLLTANKQFVSLKCKSDHVTLCLKASVALQLPSFQPQSPCPSACTPRCFLPRATWAPPPPCAAPTLRPPLPAPSSRLPQCG